MSLTSLKQKVLAVLAENVKQNPHSGPIDTYYIADQLKMSIKETQQIIKSMDGTGVIESSMDGEYALITQKGIHMAAHNRQA